MLAMLSACLHPGAPAQDPTVRGEGARPEPRNEEGRASEVRARAATVTIDAGRPLSAISPLLYGQFLEYMFEGVKGGLHAELIRDRGFERPANAIGLPRDWERYPDD